MWLGLAGLAVAFWFKDQIGAKLAQVKNTATDFFTAPPASSGTPPPASSSSTPPPASSSTPPPATGSTPPPASTPPLLTQSQKYENCLLAAGYKAGDPAWNDFAKVSALFAQCQAQSLLAGVPMPITPEMVTKAATCPATAEAIGDDPRARKSFEEWDAIRSGRPAAASRTVRYRPISARLYHRIRRAA